MKRIITFTIALLLLSGNVFAGDFKPYVSGSMGFIIPDNGWDSEDSDFDLDTGFRGTFAIGAVINSYFKTELEYSRMSSNLNKIENEGTSTFTNPINGETFNREKDVNLDGTGKAHTLMINSYLTMPRKKDSWFSPYIGAGIGMAWQKLEATLSHATERTVTDDEGRETIITERVRLGEGDWEFNETDFAYQVFVGNTWELIDIVTGEIGYTYFHTDHIRTHGATVKLIYAF